MLSPSAVAVSAKFSDLAGTNNGAVFVFAFNATTDEALLVGTVGYPGAPSPNLNGVSGTLMMGAGHFNAQRGT